MWPVSGSAGVRPRERDTFGHDALYALLVNLIAGFFYDASPVPSARFYLICVDLPGSLMPVLST